MLLPALCHIFSHPLRWKHGASSFKPCGNLLFNLWFNSGFLIILSEYVRILPPTFSSWCACTGYYPKKCQRSRNASQPCSNMPSPSITNGAFSLSIHFAPDRSTSSPLRPIHQDAPRTGFRNPVFRHAMFLRTQGGDEYSDPSSEGLHKSSGVDYWVALQQWGKLANGCSSFVD